MHRQSGGLEESKACFPHTITDICRRNGIMDANDGIVRLEAAGPSSPDAPSGLHFPTFSTEIERTLITPYIGEEHAKNATPMELLNFHASRTVLQKLQKLMSEPHVTKQKQEPEAKVAPRPISLEAAKAQLRSWGVSKVSAWIMSPYNSLSLSLLFLFLSTHLWK